ncbi:hypothetical protein L218DRAFT_1075721 [Marasmius fiardii PR-910]|nr:hypothetical protein L218DRAFT_1075721 [Marasmius fiardii PR-910]
MSNVQSDAQGLQNLLQSIAPDAVENVTPEALQRLTEKLSELMGEDVVRTAFSGTDQGLPLVDITPGASKSPNEELSLVEEPPLVPFSSLSPTEREIRRRERDRILDLLEQEEEEEQRKTDVVEKRERQAALEKRREAAKSELDRMKMMKESHKKMGKALMRSMAEARDNEAKLKEEEDCAVRQQTAGTTSSKRKTVTFAGVDEDSPSLNSISTPKDWGDLSKGRLRQSPRPDLMGNHSEHLMKKNVVERTPGSGQVVGQPETKEREADSDDESDSELPLNSDSDRDDLDANQNLEEEEFDMDFALHQREIALAYQEKRGKVGEEAAIALTSHSHEPDEEPLSEKLKGKTSVSKFRANRLASAFAVSSTSPSQSLGTSIIPATGADTLQRAIRTGNIDEGGRLVGGEHESEDEDNATMNDQEQEAVQEVLELLKKGQVYNLGPDGGLHSVPPEKANMAPFTMPTEPPASSQQKEKGPSRFKFVKSQTRGASASSSNEVSGSSTPISTADRSSPKLPAVTERVAPSSSSSKGMTVVNSPSFPNAGSTIIESPSFPSPQTRPQRPPAVMATAVKEKGATNPKTSSDRTPPPPSSDEPPKRISRFKAERM